MISRAITQKEICDYLINNKIKDRYIDAINARIIIKQGKVDYVIGFEDPNCSNSDSRFFGIYFEEIRADQRFVQLTPMVCFRQGYLEVDRDGNILLRDMNLRLYNSSKNFYFEEGQLKTSDNWTIATQERLSSTCVKGLLSVGLFAVIAAGTYYAATNIDNLKLY